MEKDDTTKHIIPTDRSHAAYAGVLTSRIRRDFMHPPMYGISRFIPATKTAEVLIEYD